MPQATAHGTGTRVSLKRRSLTLQLSPPVSTGSNWRSQKLKSTLSQDAGQLVIALAHEISARPHRAAGWRNVSARWADDGMQTEWQRAHGSYMSLATHLTTREFTLDETTGTVTERYEFVAPATAPSDIDQLLAAAPSRLALLDALAALPGKWTISPPQLTGNAYPVKKSVVTGSVTGFAEARAAARFFSAWPVSLSSISVRLNSRPEWRFTGEFHAPSN